MNTHATDTLLWEHVCGGYGMEDVLEITKLSFSPCARGLV